MTTKKELEDRIKQLEDHAEALDKNWELLHDAAMRSFRTVLGMPDATIPEMIERIRSLKATVRKHVAEKAKRS